MTELWRRLRYLVERRRHERELAEEMETHRDLAAREERGAAFGSQMRWMETSREVWGWGWVDAGIQDLRYGFRVLGRSKGFTLTAVLVLALGIGVNLTAFRVLLAATTPTVRDPETLVEMVRWFPNGTGSTIAYPVLAFYAEHSSSFRSVMASREETVVFGTPAAGHDAENATVEFVTPSYFAEEAPAVLRGRGLSPALDEERSPEAVAVVSQRFWEHRLGGVAGVVGQSVRLNGKLVHIAGVLGNPREHRVDLWMAISQEPAIVDGSRLLVDWTSPTVRGTARLKPGVTVQAAEEESRALAAALRESHPEAVSKDERLALTPFSSSRLHPQEVLAAAMAATLVMLILVVACANLGTLLLARGMAREREIRTRLALGASRFRVVRQLLTESTLLALLGSLSAWALSALALEVFLSRTDGLEDWRLALDWRVSVATLAISLVAAAAFGIAPALRVTGARPQRGRSIFLAAQVGASCVLLMISGQLLRSYGELLRPDPGFAYQNVLTISPGLDGHGYDNAAAERYFGAFRERLLGMAGVEGASVTWLRVWGDEYSGFFEGGRRVSINRVDANFIGTVGLRLSRGRNFVDGDHDAAIVSESFARRQWGGDDPIGKRLTDPAAATVVGVVAKAGTFDVQDADAPGVYYPLIPADYAHATVVIRAARAPGALIDAARSLDSRLHPVSHRPEEILEEALSRSRTQASILGSLGALASILAAIGLAGLTGFTVSQRTREIGVRMALGAPGGGVIWAVVRPLVFPVAVGMAGGTLLAGGISMVLRNNLSSLRPADPISYVLAMAMFLLVAGLAVSAPALRAVRVEPTDALRHE